MTRVTNLAQHTLSMSHIRSTQARLLESRLQISTGKVTQTFAGIAKDAARLISLKADHASASQFIKNGDLASSRLDTMETSVTTMFDMASDLRALILQAQSSSSEGSVPLRAEADNMLINVTGLLNKQHAGRYLFSGSMTNTAAVVEPVPDPTVWGTPDSTYYQGDSVVLNVRADENFNVPYGVTGDAIGFQRLIGALKAASSGAPPGGPYDQTRLSQALDLINTAIDDLTDIRSGIGSSLTTLESANQRHRDFMVNLEGFISDVENADIAAALTRLNADQFTLEASFAAVARLSEVQLLNFLR